MLFFYLVKLFMYWSLIGRLEYIFEDTVYSIRSWMTHIFRVSTLLCILCLYCIWIYEVSVDLRPHETSHDYQSCWPLFGRHSNFTFHVLEMTAYNDLVWGGILSFVYSYQLYHISVTGEEAMETSYNYMQLQGNSDHTVAKGSRPASTSLTSSSWKERILYPNLQNIQIIVSIRKTLVLSFTGKSFFFFFFLSLFFSRCECNGREVMCLFFFFFFAQ
ncbi:hypothetical protein RFI_30401 [Reticulomyxa filosa]|uniref:Uncharacterized protein n=1 Tax=Reticulomyxa filosa TaxID=46433 RepID=X6LYJ7_RETFI|nr:hypothetical protein RFI_30401 [Reticulomyxa filosa]|eukprot:ETO06988.1 hypothetical protein RFI_30401 [Reticulomyxa filosa]